MATGGSLGPTSVTRDGLDFLVLEGHLDAHAWRRSRELAGFAPDAARWPRMLEAVVTIGAALLLATALVFFIAYNWTEMGRFARLALLEAAVVLCAALAWWLGPRTLAGRAALSAGIIAIGALLAFIGQTYQTGADPWQLFAAWTALSIPWALAAGWGPGWSILLVTANLALGLYIEDVAPSWRWLAGEGSVFIAMSGLNAAAALLAEAWGPKEPDGVHRLLPRLAVLAAVAFATGAMLAYLLDKDLAKLSFAATYAGVIVAVFFAYRRWRRDLLLLSAWSLSLIVVIAAALIRLFDKVGDAASWMMIIAVVVVGLSAWAAHWIRGIAREAP